MASSTWRGRHLSFLLDENSITFWVEGLNAVKPVRVILLLFAVTKRPPAGA